MPAQKDINPLGTMGKGRLPKPIVFWSDNERDAMRRNRVVQTRCSMILEEIKNQRETSRKSIRYEAHKFRQKSGKYLRHPASGTNHGLFVGKSGICKAETNRTILQKQYRENLKENDNKNNLDTEDGNGDEGTQFPKMTGIITRVRKPSVRFSECEMVHENSGRTKFIKNKDSVDGETNVDKSCETITELKHVTKRSLSAVPFKRENDNRLFRRHKSAVELQTMTFQSDAEMNTHINGPTVSSRSDTFFVKSKAAYQLRQDLRRQAHLRKKGFNHTPVTLNDYLNAERENYIKSRGKIMEYIKRIDSDKLFSPLIINKWTVGDLTV